MVTVYPMMRSPQQRFSLLTQVARTAVAPEPAMRPALEATQGATLPGRSLRDYSRIGAAYSGNPTMQPQGGREPSATLHAFHPARDAAPKSEAPPTIQRSHGCTLW